MPENQPSPLHQPLPLDQIIETPGLMWWQITLIILPSLVILWGAYLLFKHASKKREVSISAKQKLEASLHKLLASNSNHKVFAVEISILLRQYLLNKFQSPTLFQTDQEINSDLLSSIPLPQRSQENVLEFLNQLQVFKFKQSEPSDLSQQQVSEQLKTLVIEIESKPPVAKS